MVLKGLIRRIISARSGAGTGRRWSAGHPAIEAAASVALVVSMDARPDSRGTKLSAAFRPKIAKRVMC
jgi:hypothetical protein